MFKTLSISAILFALAIIPTASADGCNNVPGVANVCTFEGNYQYGTCDNGYNYGYTDILVFSAAGFAEVYGSGYCGGYPGYYDYSGSSVGFAVNTQATGWAYAYHYNYQQTVFGSEYSYCNTYFYSGATGYQTVGCPAGPVPNPGWGNLLP